MSLQLATRIDNKVKKAVSAACRQMGVKMKHFVEEALLDKLEEYLDLKEVARLRKEAVRPLEDVIRDLEHHGKI